MDTQLNWRKSTFSGQGNSCVEVANLPGNGRAVRDSKLGEDSPILTFRAEEWTAFIGGVRAGEFD
jgi:Domain of unknown function (DUF397)